MFREVLLVGLVFILVGCANRVTINIKDNRADLNVPVIEKESINFEKIQGELSVINFDFDSYEIKASETNKIFRNAMLLNKFRDLEILIEGHCDERGSEEYNLNLGKMRANEVRQQYILLGVMEDRVRVVSYGESNPIALGHDENSWAKNRRVETKVRKK